MEKPRSLWNTVENILAMVLPLVPSSQRKLCTQRLCTYLRQGFFEQNDDDESIAENTQRTNGRHDNAVPNEVQSVYVAGRVGRDRLRHV